MRIGLMWWVVLLAYPLSRPFLLYANPFMGEGFPDSGYTPPAGLAAIGLGGLSLLHAIAAGWVVARALEVFEPASGFGKTVTRGVFVAWFAVSSWIFLVMASLCLRSGGTLLQRLGEVAQAGFASILALPLFAFTLFWKATCPLIPLGIATVLIVRRDLERAEAAGSSAGQVAKAS
ncbi:MAG TPA: hypothetical protein VFY71_17315 [Planctomycetota bacterium]|nr:hypothetical protein [Planctomycetota bacterium]